MRWDNLLADQCVDEGHNLPLFKQAAVLRRFPTPEFKGITFYEVMAKSIINHVPGDRFGFSWTINPYRGCSHACVFCFARPTHAYLDFDAGKDFDTQIVVKVNAVELLRRELRKPSWSGASIAMGTNTDPYQRAEGHYKLMRGILTELNTVNNPYSILTKGTLIQRDIDLLVEGAAKMEVSANFSVGTVDEKVWRETEPGTPHPMKRLEVVQKLNAAGVPCGVLMAPILPGISDSIEQLEATVKAIASSGATHIHPIVLHLKPGVREEFMPWLKGTYPDLVGSYTQMYKRTNAPKSASEPITKAVHQIKRRHAAAPARSPRYARSEIKPGSPQFEQKGSEQMHFDLPEGSVRKAPKWVKTSLKS